MPLPPQFQPGYVPKAKTAATTTAPTTVPTGPKKFVPTKKPATALSGILKANGIDPKTATTILSQFKAADS